MAHRYAARSLARPGIVGNQEQLARVIFCVEQGGMVLLHGFIKKTQKTPQREIDLALKRKKGDRA